MASYLSNTTASLWMLLDGGTDYPSDGQGAVTGTAASSLTVDGSASKPVILEAVEVFNCTVAGTVVLEQHGGAAIETIGVPAGASLTQRFPIGGPHGLRVNSGIRASSTGTIGAIRVFFRFPI